MKEQPVFYPQARIAAKQSAKTAMLSKFFLFSSWLVLALGVLAAALTAVFITQSLCTPAWISGIVTVLMLAQVPLLALIGAGLAKTSQRYALQERDLMNNACLHGEIPWTSHSLGYGF